MPSGFSCKANKNKPYRTTATAFFTHFAAESAKKDGLAEEKAGTAQKKDEPSQCTLAPPARPTIYLITKK